ncbi:MAG: hypothetical protein ACW98X_24525 [Promethearchaeota archaeon]
MSVLFSPKNTGQIEIKNRIVRSGTYEDRAFQICIYRKLINKLS